MSGEEQIKLVLNIDTPQFFQNQNTGGLSTGKRKSDQPIGHPPSKKQRSSHPSGKSFKSSRLKVVSSLQSLKDSSLLKDRKSAVTSTSPKSKILDSHDSENGKQKVTFSSKVEIFSSKDESSNDLPTFMQPDNVSKRKVSNKNKDSGLKQNATAKPAKPISSLFSKNPDIPSIEQKDRSELKKQEVFSTLTFNELDISPKLISTLEKLGYSSMTYVQHLSIPVILKGSDALVKSQTGSGKTLVYVLPIIHKLMVREPKVERSHGLYALIIVPTRELAIQTYQWLEKLCKSCVWVVPGYLMGGEKKKAEKARLRKGINILVATPGRLMDHIDNTSSLDLNKVEYLVLDEADRMLDLGYEKGITSIVYSLNKEKNSDSRQTLMLSATLTSAVEKLAGISLKSPKVIDVTSDTTILEDGSTIAEGLVTPQNLTQHFMLVPVKLRLVTLASFIIEKCKFSEEKKMLVFMTTQDMVDYHTSLFAHVLSKIGKMKPPPSQNGPSHSLLKRANKVLMGIDDDDDEAEEDDDEEDIDKEDENDIHFVKLHGNMSQPERTAVFKSFHEATSGVLLCTDVASRGLDLPQVNWIVQYNPAITPADYVHRVGRTARASMSGSAVVFVSPSESNYVTMLEEQGIQFDQIMMEKVLRILTRRTLYNQDFEKVPSSMEIAATRLQDKFENAVQSDKDLRDMAVQGYVSFVRSYAAIPKAAREYFCFKLLHLGHYAKSFALRDPPAVLGARGAKKRFRSERPSGHTAPIRRRKEEFNEEKPLLIQRVFSEFDSGLDD